MLSMLGGDNSEGLRPRRTSRSSGWVFPKMDDDESASTASIACEPCRQKKCKLEHTKCDRQIPICSQCESSPGKCQYPEQSRRGIPAGYLNTLENRLAETERALFFALAEIHTGVIEESQYPSAAKKVMKPSSRSKAEMMANWARRPLSTRDHTRAWFLDNHLPSHDHFQRASATFSQEAFENPSNPSSTPSSSHEQLSPSGSHIPTVPHWVSSRRVSSHIPSGGYDSPSHGPMNMSNLQIGSPSCPGKIDQELVGSQGTTTPPAGNQSRAKILARENKRTYF